MKLIIITNMLLLAIISITLNLVVAINVPRSVDLTVSGSWCWFADPRAVHYKDVTYVGYIDTWGNITIASYDHLSKSIEYSTMEHNFTRDDHSNPTIHILPDEHILVFWSGHFGGDLFYRRSVKPLSIEKFEPKEALAANSSEGKFI